MAAKTYINIRPFPIFIREISAKIPPQHRVVLTDDVAKRYSKIIMLINDDVSADAIRDTVIAKAEQPVANSIPPVVEVKKEEASVEEAVAESENTEAEEAPKKTRKQKAVVAG